MNITKRIIMVAAMLSLLAFTAHAQLGAPAKVPALTFTGTTNIAGASTNTYAPGSTNFLAVSAGDVVTLSWRFTHVAAASTANVLTLSPALEDGKPATTANIFRWSVLPNGATEVVGVTNITFGAATRVYVTSSECPSANGITNSVLSYRVN